jgi:hypothetical protein
MSDHGFLVVKRFDVLYRQFAADPRFNQDMYALPLVGTEPERLNVRYHGLDRVALTSYGDRTASLGELRLHELEQAGRFDGIGDNLITTIEDAEDVLGWTQHDAPGVYELVCARIAGGTCNPPTGWKLLGFEPSYFVGDHFSAICDCMCFPRWHGTDDEGTLFLPYFQRLNRYGLFDSASEAEAFLAFYLSHDWTETGDYEAAEVWMPIHDS